MLWVKAFHIIAIVCWFAALFYLPRLFVYHAMSDDEISQARFKMMQRKLYRGIATPSMLATVIFGVWLVSYNIEGYRQSGWFHAKLTLIAILIGYHFYSGRLMKRFALDENKYGHVFYRWFNEFPVLLLFAIVILAVVKPF